MKLKRSEDVDEKIRHDPSPTRSCRIFFSIRGDYVSDEPVVIIEADDLSFGWDMRIIFAAIMIISFAVESCLTLFTQLLL